MRYVIKTETFKSERCKFLLSSMEAWSYDWWKFVECRKDTVYFNSIFYSMQTSKQQSIVRGLLNSMGIKYKTMYVKAGLQNIQGEIQSLNEEIDLLNQQIANPRSRQTTNEYRQDRIRSLKSKIVHLKTYDKLKVQQKYVLPHKAHQFIRNTIDAQRQRAKKSGISLKEVEKAALKNWN